MSRTNHNLSRTIGITPDAIEVLERAAELSGMPMGKLASLAIERAFDPDLNPNYAVAIAAAREQFARTVLAI